MSYSLPVINFDKLLEAYHNYSCNSDTIESLISQRDFKDVLKNKIAPSTSYLNKNSFYDFWKIFIYFFTGEIETKIIIENYIAKQKSKQSNTISGKYKKIMKLSGYFITFRQNLMEDLYEFIINHFKVNSGSKYNINLFFDVENFIILLMKGLKASNKDNNRFHRQIIDDFEVSLKSALNIGNFSFNIKDKES